MSPTATFRVCEEPAILAGSSQTKEEGGGDSQLFQQLMADITLSVNSGPQQALMVAISKTSSVISDPDVFPTLWGSLFAKSGK